MNEPPRRDFGDYELLEARPEALERREPGLAVQRGDADLDAVGLLVEGHPRERIPVGDRERADVVVEAGDGHRAVGLVQAGEELRQRVQWVLDCATVPARVEIAPRAGDDDVEREEPLGRDRDRGLRGPPHRAVRRDDEVGLELAAVVAQNAGEARAALQPSVPDHEHFAFPAVLVLDLIEARLLPLKARRTGKLDEKPGAGQCAAFRDESCVAWEPCCHFEEVFCLVDR